MYTILVQVLNVVMNETHIVSKNKEDKVITNIRSKV